MKKLIFLLRVVTAIGLVVFLLLAPPLISAQLNHNYYREWLKGGDESFHGIIKVWHIVEFKPYQGSVTAFIEALATSIEAKHPGVYFEITGLTYEAAESRLARGEQPHVWSFPIGMLGSMNFRAVSGNFNSLEYKGNITPLYMGDDIAALPYLFSGYFLMGNTVLMQRLGLTFLEQGDYERLLAGDSEAVTDLLQSAMNSKSTTRYGALIAPSAIAARLNLSGKLGESGDFKAQQVPLMIGDARAYGDEVRRENAFSMDVVPLGGFTDLLQYIGMDSAIDDARVFYAEELISLLLDEAQQRKLCSLGALPVTPINGELQFSDSMLQSFYNAYSMPVTPEPQRFYELKESFYEAAKAAVEGGEGRLNEFKSISAKVTT